MYKQETPAAKQQNQQGLANPVQRNLMNRRFRNPLLLVVAALLLFSLSLRYVFQRPQDAPTGGESKLVVDGGSKQETSGGNAVKEASKEPARAQVLSYLSNCGYVATHDQKQVDKICQPEQSDQRPVCLAICVDHLDQRDFRLTRLAIPSGASLFIYVHPSKDMISNSIAGTGGWDAGGVGTVLRALAALPGAALVDIGCNLGVFSMRAAQTGRRVVSIDANYQNVIRLRKSMMTNRLDILSEVYWNALSTEPGTLKMRLPSDCNIGGGLPMTNQQQSAWLKDPIEVRTVGLDTILVGSQLLKGVKELVIKMDIEGCEWGAMATAGAAFSEFGVAVVVMEWRGTQIFHPEKANFLLQFFGSRNYTAFTLDQRAVALNPENQKNWPADVKWIRGDYVQKLQAGSK